MTHSDPVLAPAKSSPLKRYGITLLIGLLLGVVATVFAIRAIESGKTPKDRWADASMTLIAVHNGQIKASIDNNRCAPTDTLPHLQTLRRMADDLEYAFTDLAGDQGFIRHAANFRAVLDSAVAAPPLSCESLGQTLGAIGEQCKACHADYKD